jgi:hypothetical protein
VSAPASFSLFLNIFLLFKNYFSRATRRGGHLKNAKKRPYTVRSGAPTEKATNQTAAAKPKNHGC